MTNLEKLEADIRLKLPRLMELTEGCLFNFKLMDKTTSKTFKVQWIEGDIINANNGYCRVISSSVNVIGHDIKLNDVLEWLGKIDKNGDYIISLSGILQKWDEDLHHHTWIRHANGSAIRFDFSKTYLKDQSQELIDYLAGLI